MGCYWLPTVACDRVFCPACAHVTRVLSARIEYRALSTRDMNRDCKNGEIILFPTRHNTVETERMAETETSPAQPRRHKAHLRSKAT